MTRESMRKRQLRRLLLRPCPLRRQLSQREAVETEPRLSMTSIPKRLLLSQDARVGGLAASVPLQLIVRLRGCLNAIIKSELQVTRLLSLVTTDLVALARRLLTKSLSQPKFSLRIRPSLRSGRAVARGVDESELLFSSNNSSSKTCRRIATGLKGVVAIVRSVRTE